MSKEKKNIKQTNEIHETFARELVDIIRSNGKVCRQTSLRRAAESFRLLVEQDGAAEQDIRQALMWYRINFKAPYVPRAYTADQFRSKYPQILDAIERASGGPSRPCHPSELARALADEYLMTRVWPPQTGKQMAGWIDCCLAALRKFEQVSGELATATEETRAAIVFADDHDKAALWIETIYARYGAWSNWRGDLMPHVWDPGHPEIPNYLKFLGIEYPQIEPQWHEITQRYRGQS